MAISENITITQIAKHAGVSTATASRAINQASSVREETRNRVLQAMKDLNCQIKRNNNKVLLASFTDFTNPFYGECIAGMQSAASRKGYQLLLQQIENADSPSSYNFITNSKLFQGIIFCHVIPSEEILESVRLKYPIVMCSQYNSNNNAPRVVIDDFLAAKSAVNYLISVGKRNIAFINSSLAYSYSCMREKGYLEALSNAGLTVKDDWIVHLPGISFDIAYSISKMLLSEEQKPDAVFCASDVFACAVVKAAHALNISIPDEVAVMGFDNVYLSNMTVPTISTVSQPTYQLGYQSCCLLIDQIEGNAILNSKITLDTEIIVRSST